MRYYREQEVACLAKREGNSKRGYLYVNPLQGKHMPTRGAKLSVLIKDLKSLTDSCCGEDNTLIIAFAETATALGLGVAVERGCNNGYKTYCIQTTREKGSTDCKPLYFTEDHSHAMEQKIETAGLAEVLTDVTKIIFIDDEVTTGNTILHAINALEEFMLENNLEPTGYSYGIVTILNSMPDATLEAFAKKGIDCKYIRRVDNAKFRTVYEQLMIQKPFSTQEWELSADTGRGTVFLPPQINMLHTKYKDSRYAVCAEEYYTLCSQMVEEVWSKLEDKLNGKNVLILGTEEFMFPAVLLAVYIETYKENTTAWTQSTTRSPIEVVKKSRQKDYPLTSRYEMPSCYDPNRVTYLYNLTAYDEVVILTDSQRDCKLAMSALVEALKDAGIPKEHIHPYRWGRN